MRTVAGSLLTLCYVASFLLVLSACSSSDTSPEPEAKELVAEDKTSLPNAPERNLYVEGKRLYQSGLYTLARENFESLRTNYPLSPYVEFAEVKIADTYFQSGEYADAALGYEQFIKTRPASESAAYAMLMAGRSNHLSFKGVGRDVSGLEKAVEMYDKVLQHHPDSIYAISASKYKRRAQKKLAANEREIIEFYRRRKADQAVSNREQLFEIRWASLAAQPGESIKTLSLAEIPISEAAIRAAAATVATTGDIATAATSSPPAVKSEPARSVPDLVQRVDCRGDRDQQVTFFLNSAIDDSFLRSTRRLAPENGKLQFVLPGAKHQAQVIDCFASDDLIIGADNRVQLTSNRGARLMQIDNPLRLIMLLEQSPK